MFYDPYCLRVSSYVSRCLAVANNVSRSDMCGHMEQQLLRAAGIKHPKIIPGTVH